MGNGFATMVEFHKRVLEAKQAGADFIKDVYKRQPYEHLYSKKSNSGTGKLYHQRECSG